MQDIDWSCRDFEQLTPGLLYAILQLRAEVFVIEQECIYQDMDNNDQAALHAGGRIGEELVCYSRILPPGLKYEGASIGRVITRQRMRKGGYGKLLMNKSIDYCRERWPRASITLSAQHHLEGFYVTLGFVSVSAPYMEDGIPHIEMLMPAEEI